MFSCSHISKMQLDAINHRIRVHYIYIYIYTICNFYSYQIQQTKWSNYTRHFTRCVHVCVSVFACVFVCVALARATTISPNICAISQCACLPLAAGQPSGLCLSPTLSPHTHTHEHARRRSLTYTAIVRPLCVCGCACVCVWVAMHASDTQGDFEYVIICQKQNTCARTGSLAVMNYSIFLCCIFFILLLLINVSVVCS